MSVKIASIIMIVIMIDKFDKQLKSPNMHIKENYYVHADDKPLQEIAHFIYPKIFRTDFTQPGFGVIDFGKSISSVMLRSNMIDLRMHLSMKTFAQFGKSLNYEWLGRFDQQQTTKFHLDNAADQSFLMLGYEPSKIKSRLFFADYMQFVRLENITENEYFDNYNPVFADGEKYIKPFITEIENFDESTSKIILINNSNSTRKDETIGVLHKAEIPHKDLSETRVVNSIMLCFAEFMTEDTLAEKQLEFITTNTISK